MWGLLLSVRSFVSTGSTVGKTTLESSNDLEYGDEPEAAAMTDTQSDHGDGSHWRDSQQVLMLTDSSAVKITQTACNGWCWQPALHYNFVKLIANHRAPTEACENWSKRWSLKALLALKLQRTPKSVSSFWFFSCVFVVTDFPLFANSCQIS